MKIYTGVAALTHQVTVESSVQKFAFKISRAAGEITDADLQAITFQAILASKQGKLIPFAPKANMLHELEMASQYEGFFTRALLEIFGTIDVSYDGAIALLDGEQIELKLVCGSAFAIEIWAIDTFVKTRCIVEKSYIPVTGGLVKDIGLAGVCKVYIPVTAAIEVTIEGICPDGTAKTLRYDVDELKAIGIDTNDVVSVDSVTMLAGNFGYKNLVALDVTNCSKIQVEAAAASFIYVVREIVV